MKSFDRVILIDKPAGISSFGVVARVRRELTNEAGQRIKVGHTGTLDPFATGLMILLSGKFTHRANEFSKLDKVYQATIHLGATSTTGDPEGKITQTKSILQGTTLQKVEKTLSKFVGKITQTPPIYSAIKIDGQRAYKLARKGETPKIPSRQVEIYSLEILDYEYPNLKIRVHCSSGTYIRTLAEDIGKELGTGAYTTKLRRTKVGQYDVEAAEKMLESPRPLA
ncbi:tRNA pseudouridine(55) synthase TruB [Candidatus Saccharibacteria bacterium]|nr:tRNA pseudouridine(55) synthase TruB [Candidatus Saccharibacteria bacterium]